MYFSGRVHTVIYEDPARAFYILRMEMDDSEDIVSVKGFVPGLHVEIGTWFGFEAAWTNHPKFGRQLNIRKAPVVHSTWDADTATKVLVANDVGYKVVRSIREYFGDIEFVQALSNAKQLEDVPGIDSFTAGYVSQRWAKVQAFFKGLEFLLDLKLPPGLVRQVWAKFGDTVRDVLSKNPWALTQIDGITFQQADEIATRLQLPMDSKERMSGFIIYAIRNRRSMGHLYMTTSQLAGQLEMLLPDVSPEDLGAALVSCHNDKAIVIDREAKEGVLALYDPWSHHIEKTSAERLILRKRKARFGRGGLDRKEYIKRLAKFGLATEKQAQRKRPNLLKVVTTAIDEWGESNQLTLSDDQKRGAINAIMEPVSILTGLPGTGKTTSIKAVVNVLQDSGVPFLLCAPTGIAAKNLGALTGAGASTIHRAFAAKGKRSDRRASSYAGVLGGRGSPVNGPEKDAKWGYGPDSPYPAEVVIVDEISMLDQHLLYRLLDCTSESTRLVFVGDAAQLPSVGPGNVLMDLIKSGVFPVTDLRKIFRQKNTSDIVFAAHNIVRGKVPQLGDSKEFVLVPSPEEGSTQNAVLEIAKRLHEQAKDFQVLSPRHAGVVGVTNLNAKLRDLLNPSRPGLHEFHLGADTIIREDDRVMVVRNDYDLGVFNGDVGRIVRIDQKAKELEVEIAGDRLQVRIAFRDVPTTIRLAYACTVHKAQGLEYDYIIMPLMDSFRRQLQRNLLYTAVTRAKKAVILVGTHTALEAAVFNDKEDQRCTFLQQRLLSLLGTGAKGTTSE